jgi:hypothetical protein
MLRHNWVEVKDGVLRQYPVYRCDRCMTIIKVRDVKDGSWNDALSDRELCRMTPDIVALSLGIVDDCELQLVKNITND